MPIRSIWGLFLFAAILVGSTGSTMAHAQDFRDEFPRVFTETPMGVNLQTGRFRYFPFSLSIGPFQLQRGFNQSGLPFLGRVRHRNLQTVNGGSQPLTTVEMGDSQLDFYQSETSVIPWNSAAVPWKLERLTNSYRLTSRDGIIYTFTTHPSQPPSGYTQPNATIDSIQYPDGHVITVRYSSAGHLRFVRSSLGYALIYDRGSSPASVTVCGYNLAVTFADENSSCAASTQKVILGYTAISGTPARNSDAAALPWIQASSGTPWVNGGDYMLTSVTDVSGHVSTASYTANKQPLCMTFPASTVCEFTNVYGPQPGELAALTKSDQVRIQTAADGSIINFGYDNPASFQGDDPPQQPGGPPVLSYAWMEAPGYGVQGNYENGLLRTLQAPGNGPYAFEYDGMEMRRATWVEGNNLLILRDLLRNAYSITSNPKSGSGEQPIVTSQTFPVPNLYNNPTHCNAATVVCTKPITQTDARGNVTDFTYDTVHGGMLTQTSPVVTSPSGSSVRPQTRNSYVQRTAMVKDASGSFIAAGPPVWLLASTSMCREGAASGNGCAIAGDQVTTTFEYGPTTGANNLLLRGQVVDAGGLSLRTCYAYDAAGNRISETQPEGTSASVPCS